MPARRPPTEAELAELYDRLWRDERRRDDRSNFQECESCGAAVRWIHNLGSRFGSNIQIVARPHSTAARLDPAEHLGKVAVFTDRTGFTIGRDVTADELEDAFVYDCHWDVCDHARTVRDRMHRERTGRDQPEPVSATDPDPDLVRRYEAWRSEREAGDQR
ncbi:MAG: hypothetical protein JWM86_2678 [Thermoleophilia bacterium]|nr:hypothetical protein [Thermoleophilia bacterium]